LNARTSSNVAMKAIVPRMRRMTLQGGGGEEVGGVGGGPKGEEDEVADDDAAAPEEEEVGVPVPVAGLFRFETFRKVVLRRQRVGGRRHFNRGLNALLHKRKHVRQGEPAP
jgi:hypothetical protein